MARDWARLNYNDLKQIIREQDEDAERFTVRTAAALQERENLRDKLTARDAEIRELQATIDDLKHAAAPGSTDNGDGTTTWQGLPVTVPTGLVPVAVRSPKDGERVIEFSGEQGLARGDYHHTSIRVILATSAPPVTWQAPASLPDGEYGWNGAALASGHFTWQTSLQLLLKDWTDPPKPGRYRVVGGLGTWIGDA